MSAKRKGKRRGKAPSKRAMRSRWIRAVFGDIDRHVRRLVIEQRVAAVFRDAFLVMQTMGGRPGQQSVMVGRLAGGGE
jgi:hypothetical protein